MIIECQRDMGGRDGFKYRSPVRPFLLIQGPDRNHDPEDERNRLQDFHPINWLLTLGKLILHSF
jgi:hypothetical protein